MKGVGFTVQVASLRRLSTIRTSIQVGVVSATGWYGAAWRSS